MFVDTTLHIRGGRTRHYGLGRMDETTGTQRLRKCRTGQKEPPEGRGRTITNSKGPWSGRDRMEVNLINPD